MDLRDSFRVFRQHWMLTSVLLLLTLIAVLASAIKLPPSYKASATVALLNSPGASQSIGGGNPYLSFDPSLVDAANALVIAVGNEQSTATLVGRGDTASFAATVLEQNPDTEEPFIQVSVSGRSADIVEQTLHGVTDQLGSLFTQFQKNVSAKNRGTVQVIAEVSKPKKDNGSKVKSLVGFLGVGLVLTFIIPQAVEGAAARRRTRKSARAEAKKRVSAAAGPKPEEKSGAEPRNPVTIEPEMEDVP